MGCACISISDGVLIQVCSWLVLEEYPLGVGSLLAHSSHLLQFIFIVHTQSKDVFVMVYLWFSVLGYIVTVYFIWNCFCLHLICALNYLLTYLLTYLLNHKMI